MFHLHYYEVIGSTQKTSNEIMECCGLNVSVHPKGTCWSPNLQYSCIWSGASNEIKGKWDHKSGALICKFSVPIQDSSLTFHMPKEKDLWAHSKVAAAYKLKEEDKLK